MKTKTEAAEVLLERGWTFEEIETVLGKGNAPTPTAPFINDSSSPFYNLNPVYPYPITSNYAASGYFDGQPRQGQDER